MQSKGEQRYEIENKEHSSKDQLASLGQIAAGIAHEVKNPLTAVKGFLDLLRKESPHHYIDVAYSELENALATMENLLHVSKPDMKNEPLTVINLCSELESLLYLFKDKSYDVHIEKNFTDTDAQIYGKRNQIKKAFFNLIKNAFEAIGNKGTISIKHFQSGEFLSVYISDTGEGIPKDKIKMLGTPFFSTKSDGTGMGLTQVFSTIYGHDGKIKVNSKVGTGTTFVIQFPVNKSYKDTGVKNLELVYKDAKDFTDYFWQNEKAFNSLLMSEGKEVYNHITDLNEVDEEFLFEFTKKVVNLLNDTDQHGLILSAKEQGRNWAKYELNVILILEWIQTIRKIYWDFLYNYHQQVELDYQGFFQLERKVNFNLDTFMKHFASSFTEYKNELLDSHRETIEELEVPVIPLMDSIAVLPIIGAVDTQRAQKIQQDVLENIYKYQLKQIIIDLSGVPYMDTAIVKHLSKIINGIRIQGCKSIMTGIRPEITNTMIELGIEFDNHVETKGSLKQAVEELTHEKAVLS
ncbi:ATP-binding protein [Alkalihalobacillus sp. AL-G]|uniref:ATP-binding protein n=1 Tax=Alkalihalobacillus sp. AL-G TaxID=2926399 RepID=UPI00272D2997|nr:ATP-binding protein [Alkalihalobacillus sp. AL-G]WLD94375.1 ATP-binding protein [Alkalihalobacillus sp. AL-G]